MSNPAQTQVVITLPTTRGKGASPLALSEIAQVVLSKQNGAAVAAVVDTVNAPFSGPTIIFVDPAPDFGSTDNYSATVTDVEGNVSAVGLASVAIPPSVLAAPDAPTLTAAFQPAVA